MKIENRTELKEYRIECQKKQSADCRVLVCGGTGCLASGSGKIYEKLKELTKDHTAEKQIAANIIANVLGLGWAATPAGLEAMEELQKLEEDRRLGKAAGPVRKRGVASNEMCTFLIVNISSLQLIPVSVIAYRSQYGSVNPTAVVGPGIAATAVSTGEAILYCRIMDLKS